MDPKRGVRKKAFFGTDAGRLELIALDIGINYLGDPWGFETLPKAKQIDLLAYWHIQHENTPDRWYLSRPATMRDILDILNASRGKAPRPLFGSPRSSVGGVDHLTRRAWEKTTKSTPAGIDWLLKG